MPHQCIECGRTFPDGSKEMLSGCPDCGGNKFQFQPQKNRSESTENTQKSPADPAADGPSATGEDESLAHPTATEPTSKTDPTESGETIDSGSDSDLDTTEHTDPALEAGSERVNASGTEQPENTGMEQSEDAGTERPEDVGTEQLEDAGTENTAQASARSDVVSPDELDRASQTPPPTDAPATGVSTDSRPDVDELRHELNEQFESIRIVSPGQYELNLMELYDRQEYIISLQEDGRYVIEMPDAWGVSDE